MKPSLIEGNLIRALDAAAKIKATLLDRYRAQINVRLQEEVAFEMMETIGEPCVHIYQSRDGGKIV